MAFMRVPDVEIDREPFLSFSNTCIGPSEVFSSLGFSGKPQISWTRMQFLQIRKQLYRVSDRLDSLAEQHPLVSEALITVSGSVRNTATLLEVLVTMKIAPISGLDPASA